jgi:hypothetical protein
VPLQTWFGGFVKRLAIVFFVVLAAALFYRSFGSAETGTGSLTLPQPAPNAVVYVNSAPRDDNVPYTMLLDSTGELVSKYNVKRVPRLFVVEDGTIGYAQDYYYEGYENTLREAIDEALANEPGKGRQSALREQEPRS